MISVFQSFAVNDIIKPVTKAIDNLERASVWHRLQAEIRAKEIAVLQDARTASKAEAIRAEMLRDKLKAFFG